MRAVLDSSVLISAFLTPENATGGLLRAGLEDRFEICVSLQTLQEIEDSLRRKRRLRRRYRVVDDDVSQYVGDLAGAVRVIADLPHIEPVCRDPGDDHVLAAALAAKADVIVTGDADLLALGAWQGIRILTVRAFLDEL